MFIKKSLLITLEFPPQIGGIANYYAGFCGALPKNKIVVLTQVQAEGFESGYKVYRSVSLTALQPYSFILKILRLRWIPSIYHTYKVIKKHKIKQILVGQILPLGYTALIIKFLFRIPYIAFTHGTDIMLPLNFAWKKYWTKRILRAAKLVIANSKFTKKQVVKNYEIDTSKIKVVYPGLSLSLRVGATATAKQSSSVSQCPKDFANQDGIASSARPFCEKGWPSRNDKRVILTVARLVKRKGIDIVLRALPQVLEKIPNLEYQIIGDGPDRSRLSPIVQTMGLGSKVKFLGAKNSQELAEYYAECDVFIMPSRKLSDGDYEGFGIVYLEAGYFGKPAVAGRVAGAQEAVIDNETGILVNPKSVDEIAQAVLKLLLDQKLAYKIGEQARKRVLKNFIWENREFSFL